MAGVQNNMWNTLYRK